MLYIWNDFFIVANWMSVTKTSLATLIRSLHHWFIISSHGQRFSYPFATFIDIEKMFATSSIEDVLLRSFEFAEYWRSYDLRNSPLWDEYVFSYSRSNQFVYAHLLRIAWYPSPSSDYHFQSEYPKYLLKSCCVQLVILGTIRPYLSLVSEIQQFYCLLFSRNGISAQFQEIVSECFSCRRYRCV